MSVVYETPFEVAVSTWEWSNVHNVDTRVIGYPEIRAVVAHVWQLCGLPSKPPSVLDVTDPEHPEHEPDAYAAVAPTGQMQVYRPCTTAMILHELAHNITDDPLAELECCPVSEREMHGPQWLANYVWLLSRLMGPRYNTFYLRGTMPAMLRPAQLNYAPFIWGQTRGDLI